jgi:hypothetical protein
VLECGPVAALARRAHELDEMDRRLRQTLPSPLRDQVRLADIRDGRIVFLAPSPAWASRLRLAQAQILAAARAMGAQAGSVVVKVVPPPAAPHEPAKRTPLSRAAAEHLETAARSLSDPELRALFLELASIAEVSDSPRGSD